MLIPSRLPTCSRPLSPVTTTSALPANAHSQNAVVRFVRSDIQTAGRTHPLRQLDKPDSDTRQFFTVTAEFVGQYPKKFIQHRPGKDQTICAINDASQRFSSAATGKDKRRNEDIGVENDSHWLR